MAYYKDLRELLQVLEKQGKLVRIDSRINKDTQLQPLVRLQYRGLPEEERKAFLFTNVCDSRGKQYDMPVAICALAGSSEIYGIGMMCPPEEIAEKLARAELSPIPPRLVASGPVQEEVHAGKKLLEHGGLDEFPVPICTPGYDVAPYFTAACWVTKDPDTGVRNVGVYRAQLKSPTRTGVHFADISRDGFRHWQKCKEKGRPLEVAFFVDRATTEIYTGVSRYAYGVDEFAVAGSIAGEPLELVKCKTVDLEVPAHAEIVVEGELTTETLEMEAPYGEAVGFIGMTEMMPYFTAKCITHRKNPIWLSILSQYPPSESSKIRQHANESAIFKHLRYDQNLTHVAAVAFHESTASISLIVIQIKKADQAEAWQAEAWQALEAAGQRFPPVKVVVAVDEDINPWDAETVNWAIGLRMQPHRDCRIVKFPTAYLNDPSIESTEALVKRRHTHYAEKPEASRLLINATLKWPYPPVSLPKKKFMEEALRLWAKEGLPPLKLREPWFGYSLGYWGDEYDEWADLAVKGEYYKTGEMRAQKNRVKA